MRRWLIAAAVIAVVAVTIPVAAFALRTDPAKVVMITADLARGSVIAFVDSPDATSDLEVSGPNSGALMSYYDVTGKSVIAAVNASNGTVTTLFLPGNLVVSGGATKIGSDAALKAASDFVGMHKIDVSGIEPTVALADHGDSAEWVVTCTTRRHRDGGRLACRRLHCCV